MNNVTSLRHNLRAELYKHGYIIEELEPEINETSTVSLSEMWSSVSFIVDFINDLILTLLLMLMMLATRVPRTPERLAREKANPHSMTVLEKIEVRHVFVAGVYMCAHAR